MQELNIIVKNVVVIMVTSLKMGQTQQAKGIVIMEYA
jgi:hypothetical protein